MTSDKEKEDAMPDSGEVRPSRTDEEYEHIAEAVLFAMGQSVDFPALAHAMEADVPTARRIVRALAEEYDRDMRGVRIVSLGDRVQLSTRETYYDSLIRVVKAPKKPALTNVLMETLAIVAYRQPVTRLEIEKIRGVKSDHAVNKLIEYDLICETGRLEAPGRPALFSTTEEFRRRFGIAGKKDLPGIPEDQLAKFQTEAAREIRLDEPDKAEDAGSGKENHEDPDSLSE
jgi:segregation and condensation protein B